MKTLTHIGGTICLPDDTADAVLDFSLALARRHLTDIVTLESGDAGYPASIILLVGHGLPLAVYDDTASRAVATDAAELGRRIKNLTGHSTVATTPQREPEPASEGFDTDFNLDLDRYGF